MLIPVLKEAGEARPKPKNEYSDGEKEYINVRAVEREEDLQVMRHKHNLERRAMLEAAGVKPRKRS